MRLAIVTDSSACVAPDYGPDAPLFVLPITIHLPTEDLVDGTAHATHRVYKSLERGDAVKSSSPSTLAYLQAIDDSGADGVAVITPASEFTVMYRSARMAAQIATVPTAVVDSRTAAAAHGLVVDAAREAAAEGMSLHDVERVAHDASRRAELVATIDSLGLVHRSGRIPSGTIESAQRLGIRPVFRLRAGVIERLALSRGAQSAYRWIRREWIEGGGRASGRTSVFHAACPAGAEELSALLGTTDRLVEFSPAMGIHTGPGVVGAAWLRPN